MTSPNEFVTFTSKTTFRGNSIEERVVSLIQTGKIKELTLPQALLYTMHMKDQTESRLRRGLGIVGIFEGRA